MEDQSDRSCSYQRSDSRVAGEKWSSVGLGEEDEIACKRVKMIDLEPLSCFDGTKNPNSLENEKGIDVDQFNKEEMPQIASVRVNLNMVDSEEERTDKKHNGTLDLNTVAVIPNLSSHQSLDDAKHHGKQSLLRTSCGAGNSDCLDSRGVGLDLNVEVVSSSVNLHPSNNHSHIRSSDVSECGSTTGTLEENEPLRRWKEMKENGFVSASYGGKPAPKQRARRTKAEMKLKKRVETAKREQVDRFTKIAAPSGLLNELNPGIINHVRNRRQVHSIIESLVRSVKLENDICGVIQPNVLKSQNNETSKRKESENINDGDDNSSMMERVYGESCVTDSTFFNENDTQIQKLSSTTNASENVDSFSNEESGNLVNVSSLSVKAATAASQWLELLHQDFKGRLAALRRSKKRVRAVINTELHFLISKEFSSNQENDPHIMNSSTEGFSTNSTADMHRARWTALFNQMDHSLSEEEKQLESRLNQVKEMQLHCDQGLHHLHWNSASGLQQLGTSENDIRSGKSDCHEKELAVHAAAASIHSTCNYLMSKENVSCF